MSLAVLMMDGDQSPWRQGGRRWQLEEPFVAVNKTFIKTIRVVNFDGSELFYFPYQ